MTIWNDPYLNEHINKMLNEENKTEDRIKSVTPDNAIELLKHIDATHDTEMAHIYADRVLCTLLRNLGFDDIVNAYENIDKWYA